jgi:hypothetical protein
MEVTEERDRGICQNKDWTKPGGAEINAVATCREKSRLGMGSSQDVNWNPGLLTVFTFSYAARTETDLKLGVVPLSVHPLFRSSALPPSHLRASSLLFREVNLDHLIGSNPEFTPPSVVYSGEPGPQNISHRQVSARPRGPRTGWPRWPKSYISRFPFPFPFLSAHFTSSSISYDTLLQIPCNGN